MGPSLSFCSGLQRIPTLSTMPGTRRFTSQPRTAVFTAQACLCAGAPMWGRSALAVTHLSNVSILCSSCGLILAFLKLQRCCSSSPVAPLDRRRDGCHARRLRCRPGWGLVLRRMTRARKLWQMRPVLRRPRTVLARPIRLSRHAGQDRLWVMLWVVSPAIQEGQLEVMQSPHRRLCRTL